MKHTPANHPSIGFVSTYPPTACGLATFTAALRRAMATNRGSEHGLAVISVGGGRAATPRPEVVYQHVNGDSDSLRKTAAILDRHDVAILQHEYGIYGGRDGAEVVDLMAGLEIPTVVTLHTVLDNPTSGQREVLERIVDLASSVVVMSDAGVRRLTARYDVDPEKIQMIPHGAVASPAGPVPSRGARPLVLTWGLIGPGKGLELAIEAFSALRDLRPLPRYVILGRTHPKVQVAHGDAYLEGLKTKAHALGLEDVVEFDGRYLDTDSLVSAIRRADMVLLPYESTEQITSGVLVEAIAAGKPVVATAFPHAAEMLGTGAGALVPHSDPDAMASSLRRLLTVPGVSNRMAKLAASIGATLHWPVVAGHYESTASALHRSAGVTTLPIHRGAADLARVG